MWSPRQSEMMQKEAGGSTACSLCYVCEEFSRGRLRLWRSYAVGDRSYLAARLTPYSADSGAELTPIEAQVLVRVLCGEQQKVVASDLAIAPSTASHRSLPAL